MRRSFVPLLFSLLPTLVPAFAAQPRAIVPVTLSGTLYANDDGSTEAIPLNIGGTNGINFFGQNFTSVYVNNNGNLTFSSAFGTYTPNGLAMGVGQPIIAPFFADVDTYGQGSGLVMYGNATVHGYPAFVANYIGVGYYSEHTDKLNSFQAILLDRSDTGSGNFDIELNYNQIQWETGDADHGRYGLGGTSAAAGYSNGQSDPNNVYFQFPGSLVNGALLDGGPNALVSHSMNSTVPGRYVFQVRNGAVMMPNPTPGGTLTVTSADLGTIPLGSSISGSLTASGGMPPYSWATLGSVPDGLTANGGVISGTPTQPGNYSVGFVVTDSAGQRVSGAISFNAFGITGTALPTGITFSPYTASVGVAGGTGPYQFSISGLPAGLTGNAGGTIVGTVTAAGTSNVSITATDSTGVSVTKTLPLTFALPAPLTVSSTTLPAGMVGQTYSQVLSGATGGAPPYTWSIASGSLPDGLSLRSGGTISGLPSRFGTFAFGIRATDVTGASAVGSASLTIAPVPLTILVPTLPSGIAKVEYPSQTISVQGGVPPYTFTVSGGAAPHIATRAAAAPLAASDGSSSGLTIDSNGTISGTPSAPGNYTYTVTATDAAGNSSSADVSFTVRAFTTDLVLSAGSVDFSIVAGTQSLPSSQTVTVQSSTPDVVIPYSVTASAADWFAVSPAGGSTPGAITVSLTSKAQALAGSMTPYSATVTVSCASSAPCAGNSQTLNVNLSVKNASPQLNVLSDLISFSAAPGASQALTQSLGLQNAGGGSIGFASVSCAAAWCGVSGVPGSIAAGQTASLTISVDPTSLGAGYYRTVLTIKASTGTVAVPVTLFVSGAPSLSLQPAGEQFQSLAGGIPNGPPQSFLVDVSSSDAVSWSASVLPGASWLSITTPSGVATAAKPGQVNFTLDPTIVAGLKPQTYYGTIRVTSSGTVNSPQDFQVVLNVGPANGAQRPNPSPAGLLFITQANATPPPQTVSVSTSSVSAISAQVSASTSDGSNWLSVTPNTGSAQPGTPLQTKVSVNPSKLSPGVYSGGINYAFSGLAVRTVNVTLIVSPAPKASVISDLAPSLSPRDGASVNCSPSLMAAAQTGLVTNFSQPTAWPTPLEILLVNDCGTPIPNGQIVATFSNGDPPLPLTLADGGAGLYTTTWTPRRTAQQTTITMRATAPGFSPVTTQIAGAVTPNTAPLLARNSTQHIYNPLAGGALAPGTLVQISGTALSSKSVSAPTGPLPTSLNGTQVLIGGLPAPVASVSKDTVNAEVPFGLAPGMQYQVIVSANGALTTPDTIQLSGTAPGVSTATGGLVAATHLDGSAVTEASPAAPGEVLVMLAAGLGLTDTPVADGVPSPASPLANAVSVPSLTIDGTPAAISFAGLQPGSVGIYQINFTVPPTAKNGDLTLVLSQDGQPGNSTVLPVKAKQ